MEDRHRGAETEEIALGAKPNHLPGRNVGNVRMPAEALALVNVREVNLHDGQAGDEDRVAKSDRSMRIRPGIEHDGAELSDRPLDSSHQLALGVRLVALDRNTELTRELVRRSHDVVERLPPVNLRLAPPEEVQVWTVQEEDFFHGDIGQWPAAEG